MKKSTREADASDRELSGRAREWLSLALGTNDPFPWQSRLLGKLIAGDLPGALDIPTGLGKTSVMAIWLVARALGASVPRRLVYVVDRRAVVDQATEVAESVRKVVSTVGPLCDSLGLCGRKLAISTLRGQFVDNREWMEDPASPAIIVGTVDMVGSRLLFEGYGTTRKMRPYQAGLLGNDALLILDEAHLVPPFEALVRAIAREPKGAGQTDSLVPPFRVLSLSATSRSVREDSFGLDAHDRKHGEVKRRLEARKRLSLHPVESDVKLGPELAKHAWRLSGEGTRPIRCIVFSDSREVAMDAGEELARLSKGSAEVELFVGGRRVFERQQAAERLRSLGFIAGTTERLARPAFVFATSAAEVGVDLDADHLVCDLVSWERMVQRLGRVNRRGRGEAQVEVIVHARSVEKLEERLGKKEVLLRPLEQLPVIGDARDASPAALSELVAQPAMRETLSDATTPEPLRPALTRALLDAWSMTSIEDHTGRPEVAPWIRGWERDEPPQTQVVWRRRLPLREGKPASAEEVAGFFEAAPAHLGEILETETFRVLEWLEDRAKRLAERLESAPLVPEDEATGPTAPARNEVVAMILKSGERIQPLRLEQLIWAKGAARERKQVERNLAGSTLVIDARMGGLTRGLLNVEADELPPTIDDGFGQAGDEGEPQFDFRVDEQSAASDRSPSEGWDGWHERFRMPAELDEGGDVSSWLIVRKWKASAETEDDRSAGPAQLLDQHQSWTREAAIRIGDQLSLPRPYVDMLAAAAAVHDEGKRAPNWQRAFHAPSREIYAKTEGPIEYALLDGYRHELGSLPLAERNEHIVALPAELRELALHLVAAHHGFARPVIRTSGCADAPPSLLVERAQQIALRFCRLQRIWGPWGLAWWEALLRAADQQASRRNDTQGRKQPKGPQSAGER